ncbi:MAG TPA: tyrosine phenol-lyase [Bacteroidales bacterium]|nr:tyrosine phenol-lyase [Bacteroidales bacterium]
MELPFAEPYKIKVVEPIYRSTRQEREAWIAEAHYNLFNLRSDQVYIDLLTDSGTGALSQMQWSEIMLGDESYAGSLSYHKLKDTIMKLLGMPYFLPAHQGRAAENVLFSAMLKAGDIVPGNSHFDTTKGHIEYRRAIAVDCTIDEAADTSLFHPFKGNIDVGKLEAVFQQYPKEKIPLCIITITNNTAGGQPVSMENIRKASEVCRKYGVPMFLDAARFAENAYFIKTREKGYQDKSIREIVLEMFSYADGATMSSKKDAIVNIGGFMACRDKSLYQKASVFNIMYEGFITYGGLAGRDLGALAQGLMEGTELDFLESRIGQVALLGQMLHDYGIPMQQPTGGHAVFIDASKFLPQVPREQFRAQTLAVELYLEGGVRGVEIGTILADRDPITRENRYPALELLRLAVPRRAYTNNHIAYVAACLKNIFDRRNEISKGLVIVEEAPIMRHFTVELKKA